MRTPSMSKTTASAIASPEPIERSERAERLEGRVPVLRFRPAGRLLGRHRAAEHELTVAGADELVGELGELLGGQVGELRGRLLVVLVLEPREPPDAPEHRREPRRVALPRG